MSKIYTQTETAEGELNDHKAVTGTDFILDEEAKRALDTRSTSTITRDGETKLTVIDREAVQLLSEILMRLKSIDNNLRLMNDIGFDKEI